MFSMAVGTNLYRRDSNDLDRAEEIHQRNNMHNSLVLVTVVTKSRVNQFRQNIIKVTFAPCSNTLIML